MYLVQIEQNAERFLKKISKEDREMILNKLYSIRVNPFHFLKRLKGNKLWRLRISKFRAIIDVVISKNKIVVVRVGYRKNIY